MINLDKVSGYRFTHPRELRRHIHEETVYWATANMPKYFILQKACASKLLKELFK